MCKGMKTGVFGGSVSSFGWLNKALEFNRIVQTCKPRHMSRVKVMGALYGELSSLDSILRMLSSH